MGNVRQDVRMLSFDGKHSVISPLSVKYFEKGCLCIMFTILFAIGTERVDYLWTKYKGGDVKRLKMPYCCCS